VIPGIIFGLGLIILLMYKPDNGLNPFYGKLALALAIPVAIAEWVLLKSLFPPKQIKLDGSNGKYYLRVFDRKLLKQEFEIESYEYGWSYQFNHPQFQIQNNSDEQEEHQKAGTNTIDLYVILTGPEKRKLFLYENGSVFDEIPNQWPYILPNNFDERKLIDFVNLEGLAKGMEKVGILKT
jgi:hypothetical protein